MKRETCCALFQILLLSRPSFVANNAYYTPVLQDFIAISAGLFLFLVNLSMCRISSELQLTNIIQRESWIPVIERIIKNLM